MMILLSPSVVLQPYDTVEWKIIFKLYLQPGAMAGRTNSMSKEPWLHRSRRA